jgi:hypothetical protein
MIKRLAVVSVLLFMSACSTFKTADKNEPKVNTEFVGGNIKITYNRSGEIDSITSSGSAKVTSTLPSAADEAYTIATLQARKQLADFIRVELESGNFIETVSKSLQEGEDDAGQVSQNVKSNIAINVRNNIRQNSKAFLRGTYVENKEYDSTSRTIRVTVKSSVRDVAASRELSKMMGN